MLLTGDPGDQLEVTVVVKNGQLPSLSGGSDERINQRECSMLASRGEGSLNVERTLMVGVSDRHRREGRKPLAELSVIRGVPR